ncbi:MAG: putative serine/threonineeeee-protein kinase Chk2 [Streblomastix strix]|uniref:Putative serine/threonineeeee-protein kinase Chk2 n=1 Tax=Streblomastix strix TaxID=222440 RepID=A0A5J4X4Q0_9EUKA|nr:MAG: putative serine/threonineeeee-protein kinase Chk2 [Streblomastix strix]
MIVIGQGSFARVHLVHSAETGLIAAKVMNKSLFSESEWDAAEAFQKGEPIPFVLKYFAQMQHEEKVYILLEFANMKSLNQIIELNSVLSRGTIRAIAKQLIEGIRLIHSRGLIHRNIKGENILLHQRKSGRVYIKITDFGLAKFQNIIEQTMQMSLKGTPLNMAPELLIGDGNADSKVDIWSAGVVLFQLVAHEYPIKSTNISDFQKQIQLGALNRPIIIKDDLFWDLLENLLSFDRTKRFSAEQALQHPYFTSTQALNEISQESHQIAATAQLAKSNGDTNITIYDIDPSYKHIDIHLNPGKIRIINDQDPNRKEQERLKREQEEKDQQLALQLQEEYNNRFNMEDVNKIRTEQLNDDNKEKDKDNQNLRNRGQQDGLQQIVQYIETGDRNLRGVGFIRQIENIQQEKDGISGRGIGVYPQST